MSEFNLRARWVNLSERRPPKWYTVFAREPMAGGHIYYSLQINDEYECGVLNNRHEKNEYYTLGTSDWYQGNFEWLEVVEEEGGVE